MKSIISQQSLTMSSREIAELTGKQHNNVMRDIRVMMEALEQDSNLSSVCKQTTYSASNGQKYPQYELDKDTCLTLLLGYDVVARMKVVKRWQELEGNRAPSIPQTLPEALRLAADLAEENHRLAHERDEAVRAKTHISAGREATVMGRLGNLVKENDRLKRDLGYSRDYKATRAIAWLGEYFDVSQTALFSQVGKALTAIGKEIGLPPRDIEDSQYGTIKAHHLDVIDLFRVRLDKDERLLAKYRKEEVAA